MRNMANMELLRNNREHMENVKRMKSILYSTRTRTRTRIDDVAIFL